MEHPKWARGLAGGMPGLLVAAGLAAPMALQSPSAAAAEIELRLGHDQVQEHTYHRTAEFFADRVAELSDDRIEVSVFPGATLGTETSMLSEVIDGNIDFSFSTTANASSFVPRFGLLSVSYLFSGPDHFARVATDEQFNSLLDEVIAEQDPGFIRVATLTPGGRNVYNNVGPIESPEDIQGMKLRVMASPIESQVWGSLGAQPVAIPFGEVYTAMQTGLVEAAENSPGSYFLNKHNEVAPYYSLTGHQFPFTLMFMSEQTAEELSDEDMEIIRQAGREASEFNVKDSVESDQQILEEIQEKYGVKVNQPDTAAFIEELTPLQDQVAEESETEALLERIRELR